MPNDRIGIHCDREGRADTVAEEGLIFGVNWQTVLLAHEPMAAPNGWRSSVARSEGQPNAP